MKKIFWKIVLFVFLFSMSLYGATPQDIALEKGETKEYEVKAENNEKNPAVYAKDLILKENSTLKVNGNIDNVNKAIVGIFVKRQGFKGGNLEIQKGAKLEVNVEVQNYTLGPKKIPLEGVRTFSLSSSNKLKIDEGATLTVKVHSNKALIPEDNHNSHSHDDEDDLFHQMWYRGVGINLGTSLEVKGNLNVESTGTGIKNYKEPSDERSLVFDKGSKTFIKAGLIGIDANTEKQRVIFKEGSYSQIIGGAYGLISKNATFEKGSKVKVMGKYGLGNFKYSGTGDKYTFQAGSEIEILANQAALYAINIKEGSTKLIAKARNVFMQVDTRVNGNENNLATLTLEKGSILEGNIDKSWKAKILMEKGTKIFADDRIDTNLDLRGELFVGPREAYENVKSKNYKEEIEKMDSVAGASVILMGKLKNQSLKSLNAKTPYENLPTDKYYTVRFNDYTYNNKIKVNFNNSNIHLRIGGADKNGLTNDKVFFSRNTFISGKGAEITLHPQNVSKVKRNMSFTLLEEEGKDVGGNKVYDLEKLPLTLKKVEIGALVFGRKDKKLNGRYIVTLADTGELSQAAKNTLADSRDSYKYNQEELKAVSDKIFENHNLELKNNFWLLVSKENLKNKDSVTKLNQNTKYAGYDHTFNTGVSLGLFVGQSTGRYKNIAQGIYLKKDLKPFYLGAIYKHTKSKDKNNDKKLHSNDFSFIAGYNKEIGEKVFVDSNIKLTRGYISDYKYTAENDLNTKNEKTNYWNGEINTKLGYKFKYGNAFLKAGLDKDLKGNQKVVWNENIDEEIQYDDLSKNIGIGMEYKLGNHSFNLELSRKYSKHYRANTKITFGYSYKF
ncbi:autotransporter outer membrane beta-barrel domain-containing protein [Fusobacterium nucleatum]